MFSTTLALGSAVMSVGHSRPPPPGTRCTARHLVAVPGCCCPQETGLEVTQLPLPGGGQGNLPAGKCLHSLTFETLPGTAGRAVKRGKPAPNPGQPCPPSRVWPLRVTQVDKTGPLGAPGGQISSSLAPSSGPGPLVAATSCPQGEQSPDQALPSWAARLASKWRSSVLCGHRFPHCSTGGNWSTSPTSVLSCSPRVNISL